jgi:serine protease inhibitor
VVLSLPKLCHESAFSLKDDLHNRGMTDAFNPDWAYF